MRCCPEYITTQNAKTKKTEKQKPDNNNEIVDSVLKRSVDFLIIFFRLESCFRLTRLTGLDMENYVKCHSWSNGDPRPLCHCSLGCVPNGASNASVTVHFSMFFAVSPINRYSQFCFLPDITAVVDWV